MPNLIYVKADGDRLWKGYRTQNQYAVWLVLGSAMAEYSLGHPDESRRALEEAIRTYGDALATQYAMVYAWRNEPGAAFHWLERAYRFMTTA